ncbi:MAG TPA: tripartite tricarboxylate transporter permease, partial [Arthrobacter sp.]
PRIEGQLRKTLQLSAGDPAGLLGEPIAVVIYVIIALILLWPFAYKLIRRNRAAAAPAATAESGGAEPAGSSALATEAGDTVHSNHDAVYSDHKERP